jgi:hypothetical protein
LPPNAQTIFLGDGEFDGIELQAALQAMEMRYVCRTAKNTCQYSGLMYQSYSATMYQRYSAKMYHFSSGCAMKII